MTTPTDPTPARGPLDPIATIDVRPVGLDPTAWPPGTFERTTGPAAGDLDAGELSAALDLHAIKLAKLPGWHMIATEIQAAAKLLDEQDDKISEARVTVRDLVDTIADMRQALNDKDSYVRSLRVDNDELREKVRNLEAQL